MCSLFYADHTSLFSRVTSADVSQQSGNYFVTLFDAIVNQTTVITALAGAVPSAQLVVDGLKHVQADSVILVPPYMEQVAKNPEMLNFITNNVKTVAYGGGDISELAGDAFASRCRLFNFNGSTETASYPILRSSGRYPFEDWKYIHPHPKIGLEFRPSIQGLFEAVMVKHSAFEEEQPVFKIFPHLEEYPTKDLFAPHPTKPNLWAFQSRADDTIVFKPGYMCNPLTFEQHMSQHPDVQVVLMAGTGRFQPALLIELASKGSLSTLSNQERTRQLWPIIEEANKMYKTGARVSRSHVLFTDKQKPMLRAGKGTVQRAPTLKLYKDALDALYSQEGDAGPGNDMALPVFGSVHV